MRQSIRASWRQSLRWCSPGPVGGLRPGSRDRSGIPFQKQSSSEIPRQRSRLQLPRALLPLQQLPQERWRLPQPVQRDGYQPGLFDHVQPGFSYLFEAYNK